MDKDTMWWVGFMGRPLLLLLTLFSTPGEQLAAVLLASETS